MATAVGVELPVAIRPSIADRFPVSAAKDVIKATLREKLGGADKVTSELSRDIAESVKSRLKELIGPGARYKLVSHVVLGEGAGKLGDVPARGAGVHIATRCMWDSAVDDMASESHTSDSLFAVATAYAVYTY